ncbi:MAG: Asp-tRNA(Asn)/Glu-tRNA(Gln) amidotransferase subunit GatC [Crocinitomicaceae bacterium]
MEITDELVDHIAHLARLNFDGENKEAIKADMKKMIGFVDQLSSVDTKGVEPLVFMSDSINVLRDDVPMNTVTQEEALKNAPKKDSDYFKIAKVLNQ